MKVTKNGYTRVKLNGVYADNYPVDVRIILSGFLFILEKHGISTGEPCYNKDKNLYGFYTSYSTFFYDSSKDDIVIYYGKTFMNDFNQTEALDVIVKRYENLNNELVEDLTEYIASRKTIPLLEEYLLDIEKYNELGEDWNSYRCNPVSETSISIAKKLFAYLYPLVNKREVALHPYPIADGGNEVRRPTDSLSIVGIEMENGERRFEIEIDKEGRISPMIYEHSYSDKTYESNGLIWPKEYQKLADDYEISDFENDEFLKWAIKYMHYEI